MYQLLNVNKKSIEYMILKKVIRVSALFLSIFLIINCSNVDLKKEYYPDGTMSEGYYDNQGFLNGEYITYDTNGNKEYVGTYFTGSLNGIYYQEIEVGKHRVYYPNDKLHTEVNYELGKKVGKKNFYTENGKLSAEFNFVNGVQQGYSYWYYPNSGNIESVCYFENGKHYGEAHVYYEDGNLNMFQYYSSFSDKGVASYYREYNKIGELIDTWGSPIVEMNLIDEQGEIEYFDGKTLREFIFENNGQNTVRLPINKKVEINSVVVDPPDCNVDFYFGVLKGEVIDNSYHHVDSNTSIYKNVFEEAGELDFVFQFVLTSKEDKTDTFEVIDWVTKFEVVE